MYTYTLRFENKHLFVEVEGNTWLIDTGAPSSFGNVVVLNFLENIYHTERLYGSECRNT